MLPNELIILPFIIDIKEFQIRYPFVMRQQEGKTVKKPRTDRVALRGNPFEWVGMEEISSDEEQEDWGTYDHTWPSEILPGTLFLGNFFTRLPW